jgi:hypothetical protein
MSDGLSPRIEIRGEFPDRVKLDATRSLGEGAGEGAEPLSPWRWRRSTTVK